MFRESIANLKGRVLSVKSILTDFIVKRLASWKVLSIFLIILLGATLPYLLGMMQTTNSIPSGGIIKAINVEVYSDDSCTIPLPSVSWGTLEPESSGNSIIYIKNEGNSDLILSLDTDEWSPLNASDYLDLTWDYSGEVLNPGQSIEVVLTLTVSKDISGIDNFTFKTIIIGTG